MSEEVTKEETQNSAGTVPSYRLREESDKRRKAEEQLSKILEEVKGLKGALAEAHSKLDTTSSVHEQDIALISAGVIDSEIREFVRERYSKAKDPGDFSSWMEGQKKNPSPLLAPFLKAQEAKAEAKPEPEAKVEEKAAAAVELKGNPNAGTDQPVRNTGTTWSANDIKAAVARNNGVGLGASKEAILKALAAEGLIKGPSV